MIYDQLPEIDFRTFNTKSKNVQRLIRQALQIIEMLGVPTDDLTDRKKERMAMGLLATANIHDLNKWGTAKDFSSGYSIQTKEIVKFYCDYFEESLAKGGYDYVLRDDLGRLREAEVVVCNLPNSKPNDKRRGYVLSDIYASIIRKYGKSSWEKDVKKFNEIHTTLIEKRNTDRNLNKMPVTLPNGQEIMLEEDEHNQIQKAIIEQLLAYYGYGAQVLYLGDPANRHIVYEEEKLKELGFKDLRHGKLPDIIAYSPEKDWIYVIEAFFSCNPIDESRKSALQGIMDESSKEKVIYITAFLDQATFKANAALLAWETEAWIAEDPTHMIHYNGDKFMGPYQK